MFCPKSEKFAIFCYEYFRHFIKNSRILLNQVELPEVLHSGVQRKAFTTRQAHQWKLLQQVFFKIFITFSGLSSGIEVWSYLLLSCDLIVGDATLPAGRKALACCSLWTSSSLFLSWRLRSCAAEMAASIFMLSFRVLTNSALPSSLIRLINGNLSNL